MSNIPDETLNQCLEGTSLIVENMVRLTEAAHNLLVAKKNQSLWNEWFEQMRKFKVEFGHCRMPWQYAANPKLGGWVHTQRCNYKLYQEGKPRSPITAERIQELESIGFDWGTSQTDSWSVRLQQLCEFKVEFGHCRMPQEYAANLKLGKWVNKQRCNYKLYQEGKPSPIAAERIQELESIWFNWGTSQTGSLSVRLQQLCEFRVEFGHCRMPQEYAANPKLGKWVNKQRCNYKLYQAGKPSPIAAERIQELESIWFNWGTSQTGPWSVGLQQMREFKVEFGHCRMPRKHAANPKLRGWVHTQCCN